jgi:superfamily II DNA or RNA helicase
MLSSNHDDAFKAISQLKANTGFIVVDEAHKAVAPTYKQCISYLFNAEKTKLIGLSATPGRAAADVESGGSVDGTAELAEFFDFNRVGLTDECGDELDDPIGYLQKEKFLSNISRKKVATDINLELTDKERIFVSEFLELPTSVLTRLAKSNERNALILAEIAALRLKKRQIIVFALSVDHAHLITELLNLKGINARCIDGATPASERAESIAKYKDDSDEVSVLVNYGVLTTGFDAPNTNAVVIARPTASLVLYSQMIGRGIRGPKVGGNEVCDLVDLEDNLLGFPSEQHAFNFFNIAWS